MSKVKFDIETIIKNQETNHFPFLSGSEKSLSPSEFLRGWAIPKSILAERLRRCGYNMTLSQVGQILNKDEEKLNDSERLMLTTACRLIKDDVFKLKDY